MKIWLTEQIDLNNQETVSLYCFKTKEAARADIKILNKRLKRQGKGCRYFFRIKQVEFYDE